MYVDKTRHIEKIVTGSQYYFLGRPRRFGKSLFLSTLQAFFEGRRDLFRGLYADCMDWDWEPFPVLSLDLNIQKYKNEGDLEEVLESFLQEKEKEYGLTPTMGGPSVRFSRLIKGIWEKTGKAVVVLVDEYDKPLVSNINDREMFECNRNMLAAFYSNFKSSAQYLRLVFLTGVSRFGKLTVFSGLNNISDISFVDEFDDICGITEEELTTVLMPGIVSLAEKESNMLDEELSHLKKWYDGYHFSSSRKDIYNPYSILSVLSFQEYKNYWISSGTPTLLVEQLKRTDTDLESLILCQATESTLSGLDIDNIRPIPLFYQTGYLTIKAYDREDRIYTLGIPNDEVREGFFEYILPYYASMEREEPHVFVVQLRREMQTGRVEAFMKRLQSMFAGISYRMKLEEERNVQNALLIVFSLIGMKVDVEFETSDGRIDILVRTDHYVYIMELKFDGTASEALAQIERKQYALPWVVDSRKIIAIGIDYSSVNRRIDSWKVAEIM